MMLTTHALLGALLAVPVAFVSPSFAPVALVAGFVGGAFPDLDILALHRRTLHYPRYYGYATAVTVPVAFAHTVSATVAVAFFFAGAWLHSLADIFGGGAEVRPWERRTERAVYDHAARRWVRPRRWVRYDGAPEDLALALVVSAPVAYAAPQSLLSVVAIALGISVVYAVFRRRVVPFAERVASVSLVGDEVTDEADKTL
ncbi:MAG: metal-dependent hydrolase [Halobacteriales archaeon]